MKHRWRHVTEITDGLIFLVLLLLLICDIFFVKRHAIGDNESAKGWYFSFLSALGYNIHVEQLWE